jgi:hypothetical protein
MIKKTIKYNDFDGVEREEDFYFHLSKADLIDWAAEEEGGFVEKIMEVSKQNDPLKIIPVMKKIIIRSYGIKTPDGKGFIKDPDAVKNFQYTEAFSELYLELSTHADRAAEFINGILPKFDPETQKELDKRIKQLEEERNADKGAE